MPALPTDKGKLKIKLQRHLNLPRRKCAVDCAEIADVNARTVDTDISDIRICRLKIRSIKQIKKLGANFEPRRFINRQSELFLYAQIEIKITVASGDIASRVAKR